MRCEHCGADYESVHFCSKTPQGVTATPDPLFESPGLRFAPIHYFEEALDILFLDDNAVQRASRDNNTLVYGFLWLAVALYLEVAVAAVASMLDDSPYPLKEELVETSIALVPASLLILAYYVACHGLMRFLFEGTGTFWRLARPLSLTLVLAWLDVVPVIGSLAGVWGLVVFVNVCQEVEGVKRWQALVAGILPGIAFIPLLLYFGTPVK